MHSSLNVATLLTEQSVKTVVTVRLVPLLFKGSFVELFQAEAAYEMLWMKLPEHCCYAPSRYRLMAPGT